LRIDDDKEARTRNLELQDEAAAAPLGREQSAHGHMSNVDATRIRSAR
jgi:hypothetical protein